MHETEWSTKACDAASLDVEARPGLARRCGGAAVALLSCVGQFWLQQLQVARAGLPHLPAHHAQLGRAMPVLCVQVDVQQSLMQLLTGPAMPECKPRTKPTGVAGAWVG